MSFAAREASQDDGVPVELYHVRYGAEPGAFFAYCDGPLPVTRGGITYTPLALDRTKTPVSGGLDKTRMSVTLPMDSPLAELFRVYPPSRVVILTIREAHYEDPSGEAPVTWVGRVLSCARAKGGPTTAELTCEPSQTSLRRTGLTRFYSLSCTHDLYGRRCRASKAAATRAGVVAALAYTKITLAPGWAGAFAPRNFIGGLVEWPGADNREYRTIMRVNGDVLSLTGPTTGLGVGDPVDVILGCNRTPENCRGLHDNILNFGGQPDIPLENPIRTNPFTA